MSYHHAQHAPWVVVALLLPGAIAGAVLAAEGHGTLAPLGLIFAVPAWLFHKLTVEVDGAHVRCSFGPGFIGRSFPIEALLGVRTVRNRWWYGWGIRRTPGAWMFNLSGLDAVELELAGGKRFRIGTDEPAALAAALQRALDRVSGS